jgi:hypothetical protein
MDMVELPAGNGFEKQLFDVLNEQLKRTENTVNSFSKPLTKSAKKLFTIGDNIGVCMGQAMYTQKRFPLDLLVGNFCKTNTFDKPKDAAEQLFEYLRSKDENLNTILHVAGYNKTNGEFPMPEIWHVDMENKKVSFFNNLGFLYGGANDYFKPFSDRINTSTALLDYSLQDAVDISKFAIDMSRSLERYLDFSELISPDIEMIAITIHGIQWVLKKELECKE